MKRNAPVEDKKNQGSHSIPPSDAQTEGWISKLETLYADRADKAVEFHQERAVLHLYLEKLKEVLNSKYGSRLKLQEPFRVGGTGVLFRAIDANIPGELVLKFNRYLPPESVSMVENERRVLLLLHHPSIIRVIHTGVTKVRVGKSTHKLSFIIEPLVPDAVPLGRYVEKSFPDWAEPGRELLDDALKSLTKLLYQWVGALNYIHHQGFIYLDVKPDNAIVDKNGRLLVVDFGSAKRFNKEEITFRSERKRETGRDTAGTSHESRADTQLPGRSADENTTNAFFTFRYAHPELRDIRRRSSANKPAAPIERSLLHPRFDYYALGKSILELLNKIAKRNPNDWALSPLFQSLHFLASRLLDGREELRPDPKVIASETFGNVQQDYERRYIDLETVLNDLEKGTGNLKS